MTKKREIAIVHFNTPELTEACIYSIRKHGGQDYHITVFDNSDKRPFTIKMDGVTVIDTLTIWPFSISRRSYQSLGVCIFPRLPKSRRGLVPLHRTLFQ